MRKYWFILFALLVVVGVGAITENATAEQVPYHSVLKRVVIAANAVDTLASTTSTTVYVPRTNGSLDEVTAWLSQIHVEGKSPFRWKSSLYGSGTSSGHTFIDWAAADTTAQSSGQIGNNNSIGFPVTLDLYGITDSLRVTGTAADTLNVYYIYDIPEILK